MKKILITLVILLAAVASGQAQGKLKVGEIMNGKLQVTNPDVLRAFYMKSLGNSGTLGQDFQVSTAPEGDRFLVYYPVTGNKDKVTYIGVMLVKIKNDAFIVENPNKNAADGPGGGGSLEVQCMGVSCNICVPNIKWIGGNWMPEVFCECRSGGGGECNMIIKIIIHINV